MSAAAVTEIDSWTRAALAMLCMRGVPEAERVGTLRAGLVLRAFLEDPAALARLQALPPLPGVGPDPTLARYYGIARAQFAVVCTWWGTVGDLGVDNPLGALWASLDRIDGARLVAAVEAG